MTDHLSRVMAALNDQRKSSAKKYGHYTIQKCVEALESLPPETEIPGVRGHVLSYRGYYEDLAIHPGEGTTAKELASVLRGAVGQTFEGYKGGDFKMEWDTLVWVAEYGRCGEAIMDITAADGIETMDVDA